MSVDSKEKKMKNHSPVFVECGEASFSLSLCRSVSIRRLEMNLFLSSGNVVNLYCLYSIPFPLCLTIFHSNNLIVLIASYDFRVL